MNWVGGSRNRLVMKNDAKKQREFFEKRKMQQRLEKLGVTLSASSSKNTSAGPGSMDLMTLFIVNQIATKKENQDPPKVAVLGRFKGGSKRRRNEPLVLPMSPGSPSQLSLVESPSQCSVQEIRTGKNVIPQKFKCRQLSPVLESAFSDNSASDYMPPITDPPSPTLSASSGQGIFPLQMNLQKQNQSQLQVLPHYSSPPWDTSVLQQTRFQPFSQPRGMTDPVSWSSRSNSPLFQVETPTAAQAIFGCQNPEKTKLSNHEGSAATFFLNQQEDTELTLDFQINQSQSKHLLEDVFRRLSDEEYETKAFSFGNPKIKISLRDETAARSSTPQTVPNVHSGLEISNCTEANSSHLDQNTELLNGCESLSSCSFKAGYLSSDSSDDESCCEPCPQASAFYMDDSSCEENLNSNFQRNPKLSELLRPNMNLRDDQDIVENKVSPKKTSGFQDPQMALSSSPHTLGPTQNLELSKCKKTPTESQDAGTQAVPETCDASTQCSFATKCETRASGCSLYDMFEQHPAAQRKAALLQTSTKQGRWAPWTEFTANKVFLQRPTNPLQGVFSPRGKENKGDGDEREDSENKEVSDGREEVTSAGRVQRRSEEAATLQEIANILLLLKQRKKEE